MDDHLNLIKKENIIQNSLSSSRDRSIIETEYIKTHSLCLPTNSIFKENQQALINSGNLTVSNHSLEESIIKKNVYQLLQNYNNVKAKGKSKSICFDSYNQTNSESKSFIYGYNHLNSYETSKWRIENLSTFNTMENSNAMQKMILKQNLSTNSDNLVNMKHNNKLRFCKCFFCLKKRICKEFQFQLKIQSKIKNNFISPKKKSICMEEYYKNESKNSNMGRIRKEKKETCNITNDSKYKNSLLNAKIKVNCPWHTHLKSYDSKELIGTETKTNIGIIKKRNDNKNVLKLNNCKTKCKLI